MKQFRFLSEILPEDALSKLSREKAFPGFNYKGIPMVRFKHGSGAYRRGTVAAPGRLAPGFPQIKRVLHLGNGLARNMKGYPFIKEDVMFFAFDVMDGTGRLLARAAKYALLERFGINTVRH